MNPTRSIALVLSLAAVAVAQDDREATAPTTSYVSQGLTSGEVFAASSQGYRITDVELDPGSTTTWSVARVANHGAFAKSSWCYVDVSAATLASLTSFHGARITDLEVRDVGGTPRFAAVMIANTGADQKGWWWYYGQTATQVASLVSANNARLTSLCRYATPSGDRFAVVMIPNVGADQRAWWPVYGQSASQLRTTCEQQGRRVYAMERAATGLYDAILVADQGVSDTFAVDLTIDEVNEQLAQRLHRAIDVECYATLLGPRYAVVGLDRANPLERLARDEFDAAPAAAVGEHGFYLSDPWGGELAGMREHSAFEPGDAITVFHHLHASRSVASGASTLGMQINKPASCGVPGGVQSLQVTLEQMLRNDDDLAALAVSNLYGASAIVATGVGLQQGMTLSMPRTLGCGSLTTLNWTNLISVSQAHIAAHSGFLGTQRDAYFARMRSAPAGLAAWSTLSVEALIDAEATARGWTPAKRDAFKSAMVLAYKPGAESSIDLASGAATHYCAETGYMRLPFRDAAGVVAPRPYVFGAFNHGYTGIANQAAGRTAMGNAVRRLVWDRIHAAMVTWDGFTPGVAEPFGAGCSGTVGTPAHAVTGQLEIGTLATFTVANCPAPSLAAVQYGLDATSYGGLTLPADLGFLGAPGCALRVAPALIDAGLASNGTMSRSFLLPDDPQVIGVRLYTQFLVADPSANAFGFVYSNAMRTTIGGWQ